MKRILIIFYLLCCGVELSATNILLDVFPETESVISNKGKTEITQDYYDSGSLWNTGVSEKEVFLSELKHTEGNGKSYAVRVGKGGQIYSLRGDFGESVPPSTTYSPWNDEVWQFVSVCSKYNIHKQRMDPEIMKQLDEKEYKFLYFIHNSGCYIRGESEGVFSNFYCPLLATSISKDARSIRTLNWGLVPQIRTINRSPILYYLQVTDIGSGVIELTYVVHNFDPREDIVFDYLNAPWGGTRISSLPIHELMMADGKLMRKKELEAIRGGRDVRSTAGYNISSQTRDSNSPSLSLVFGRDKNLDEQTKLKNEGKPHFQLNKTLYRTWDSCGWGYHSQFQDWKERPENSWRNYDVLEVIPKLNLKPQTSIWYRTYLVVSQRDDALELAASLVDKVDYGYREFKVESTPKIGVKLSENNAIVTDNLADADFKLFAHPVENSMPVFLIENTKSGKKVLTTDPYLNVAQEKLNLKVEDTTRNAEYYRKAVGYDLTKNNSKWQLLGFALKTEPNKGKYHKLSKVAKSMTVPLTEFNLELWVE